MKNLKILTGTCLALLISAVSADAAKANLVKGEGEQNTPMTQEDILLSQLRGHDLYDGLPQISWSDYQIGRVVGKSGSIKHVLLQDGTYFTATGAGSPGGDVLVFIDDNGRYAIADVAHSEWIMILQEEYGWKEVSASASLNSRTAAIWQELEASSGRVGVTAPLRQSVTTSPAPVRPAAPGPVPALW